MTEPFHLETWLQEVSLDPVFRALMRKGFLKALDLVEAEVKDALPRHNPTMQTLENILFSLRSE